MRKHVPFLVIGDCGIRNGGWVRRHPVFNPFPVWRLQALTEADKTIAFRFWPDGFLSIQPVLLPGGRLFSFACSCSCARNGRQENILITDL